MAGYAENTVVPKSMKDLPVLAGNLADLRIRAEANTSRLQAVLDRAYGVRPKAEANKPKLEGLPVGLVEEFRTSLNYLEECLTEQNELITRLEDLV